MRDLTKLSCKRTIRLAYIIRLIGRIRNKCLFGFPFPVQNIGFYVILIVKNV
jgi:hypothetical protein